MDARVVRELRVEGSDQEAALPEEHRLAVELGEHLDALAGAHDARGADEDAAQGLVLAGQVEIGLEAEDLAAVGVACDLDVEEAEMLAGRARSGRRRCRGSGRSKRRMASSSP